MRVTIGDVWVETGQGRLMTRTWLPEGGSDRAPIVLFHDSLGCVALWRGFPAVLAERTGRRVIAYDRLGFGQSDRRTGPLSPGFVRDEAERFFPALRAGLGIDRFVAFGHSVGGGMAIHCAAMHASSCEAVITESAQSFVEAQTLAGIAEARELFKEPGVFSRLERHHGDKARWVLDVWIGTWLSPGFAGWSLRDVLPQVTCPTLAVHGSDDEYGSCLHPQTIAALVSGPSELEIMPGVRHVPHREQENWVAERVSGFIASPPF